MYSNGNLEVLASVRLNAERSDNFGQLWQAVRDQPQVAPSYITVSGLNGQEGVVIERNAGITTNAISWLNPKTISNDCIVSEGCIWYLVQTNSDRSTPDYEKRDPRRFQGEMKMEDLGWGTSLEEVKEIILEQRPNFLLHEDNETRTGKNNFLLKFIVSTTLLDAETFPDKYTFTLTSWVSKISDEKSSIMNIIQ